MTGQYDPWTKARFGFPRKDAPAFQREWKPMNSSGVLLEAIDTNSQQIIEAPSSVGVSGTIYLWGISLVAATDVAQAILVEDDNGKDIITLVATENGPYFLQLSTPIQITPNSGLKATGIVSTDNSYITPLYTTSHVKYE